MMKKTLLTSALFLIIIFSAYGQLNSIHYLDNLTYGIKDELPSEFPANGEGILPLQFDKSGRNGTVIYGYLPDWEYQTARNYLRYDILTHISAFDFAINSSGNITNPSYWPWTDVINAAHQNGVKVILTAVNFTSSDIHNLLTNSTAKQNFFSNVLNRLNSYSLDGVNVDFEGLNTADRGSVLNTFMADLSAYIKAQKPDAEISFAGPAVNWGGWNLPGLANACDYIFIMGYSFYGSWSTTTGPCAPLTGGSINIANTVNTQYGGVIPGNANKLILGVPYYGLKWTTETQNAGSAVISYVSSTRFKDDIVNGPNYGVLWSTTHQTPWYRFQSGGVWTQVWYDTDSSLGLKYALAQSKNYRGVGMWALGYDGARPEYWNELYNRFYSNVPVELNSFTASVNGSNVSLNWNTSTETNNHGFEVYRKNENDEEYILAGFVKGSGTSTEKNYYTFVDKALEEGTYYYKLIQVDFNGNKKDYSAESVTVNIAPVEFSLDQNYPNPFNPVTRIKYSIPSIETHSGASVQNISLKVYDVLGREVATLVSGLVAPGKHTVTFDGGNLGSGIYFYTLSSGNYSNSRKMILMK